jgi:hypothetical protein
MIIVSLRVFEKQSPVARGDCFATARNDMWAKVNALPALRLSRRFLSGCSWGRLQSHKGDASQSAAGGACELWHIERRN